MEPKRLERGGPWWLLKLRRIKTWGVQMKWVLLWLALWACHTGTKSFLSCLGCSGQPCTKYFFLTYIISVYVSPSPSNLDCALGRQSCRATCLWMRVSTALLRFPLFFTGSYCKSTEHIKKKEDQSWKSQRKFGRLLSIGYFLRS